MEENRIDTLLKLIAEETGVPREQLTLGTKFVSIADDSLELANLVLTLEDEFKIDIENVHEGMTIGDALKLIEGKQ